MKRKKISKGISFSGQLSRSFSAMREARLSLAIPVLFTMLFIFFYGSIIGYFSDYIISSLYSLGAGILQANEITGTPLMGNIVLAGLLMILLCYLSYVIFEGASWRMSRIFAVKERIGYIEYLKKFSLLNLFWLILFLAYEAFSFFIDFKYGSIGQAVQESAAQNTTLIILKVLSWLFLIIVLYFASVSYPLIRKEDSATGIIRKAFALGYRKIDYLAPRMAFAIILLLIVDMLVVLTSRISMGVMILLGVLILLPALIWTRIYMHIIMKNIE